jgi:hypothetical protein
VGRDGGGKARWEWRGRSASRGWRAELLSSWARKGLPTQAAQTGAGAAGFQQRHGSAAARARVERPRSTHPWFKWLVELRVWRRRFGIKAWDGLKRRGRMHAGPASNAHQSTAKQPAREWLISNLLLLTQCRRARADSERRRHACDSAASGGSFLPGLVVVRSLKTRIRVQHRHRCTLPAPGKHTRATGPLPPSPNLYTLSEHRRRSCRMRASNGHAARYNRARRAGSAKQMGPVSHSTRVICPP